MLKIFTKPRTDGSTGGTGSITERHPAGGGGGGGGGQTSGAYMCTHTRFMVNTRQAGTCYNGSFEVKRSWHEAKVWSKLR